MKTPTFYVFKMYKVHQNSKMVPSTLTTSNNQNIPLINTSASVDSAGKLHISMCNTHISATQNASITLNNAPDYVSCTGTIINGPTYSYNDSNGVEPVNIKAFAASNYSLNGSSLTVSVPAHSVITLELVPQGTWVSDRLSKVGDLGFSIVTGPGNRIFIGHSGNAPLSVSVVGIDGRKLDGIISIRHGSLKQRSVWRPYHKPSRRRSVLSTLKPGLFRYRKKSYFSNSTTLGRTRTKPRHTERFRSGHVS